MSDAPEFDPEEFSEMNALEKASETFATWQKYVASGVKENVVSLYGRHSVLLPTLKGEVCDDVDSKLNYFEHFCAKLPQCDVRSLRIRDLGGDIVMHSGHYVFGMKDGSEADGRFSFVYEDGIIVSHHSSLNPTTHAPEPREDGQPNVALAWDGESELPGEVVHAQSPEELEVQDALYAWLDANASGDPANVTALYDDDAVLLPTLKGEVCDTPETRRAYFDHFTTKVPQGEVYDLRTQVFGKAAINSGHYAFKFADGSTALARFDFVYKMNEDGRWMIKGHHSSLNPSGHEEEPAVRPGVAPKGTPAEKPAP